MPTATVSADPSTRRLSEVARHVVVPAGIVDSLWFEVERQCAEWGDEFDVWQDTLGQLILGIREDGTFAATIGGVTLSIPRQVAKTFIVSRIVFALCILFPNLTVLWTAHRTRMATQTFNKLKGLAKKSGIRQYMAPGGGIRSTNGEQEFEFANGSKIMFGAREQGFGRGFDEVDIEVFDEAQILTEKALEDMVAATNQSRFPYGALLFFMGTPPRPADPGEEFTNRRAEALALKPPGQVYAEGEDSLFVECSADPTTGKPGGPDLHDLEQVAIANPSYPHRTPLVSVKRLMKQLTSPDSWRREGLGIWDEFERTERPINPGTWNDLKIPEAEVPQADPSRFALTMSPERVMSLAAAVPGDDADYLDLVDMDRVDDSRQLIDWLVARRKVPVMIDSRDPAASLANELRSRGVKVNLTTERDMGKACGGLLDAVNEGRVWHCGQPVIAAALKAVTKRDIGHAGLWEFDMRDSTVDHAPLRAMTLAHYGLSLTKKRSGSGRSSTGRTAVSV